MLSFILNEFKALLYKAVVILYPPESNSLFLRSIVSCVYRLFGLAVFNMHDIKVRLGPAAILDRFLILGRNINPFVTSALTQYFNSGGIFLDIGSNIGVLTLLAARNPNIEVIAIESSPRELDRLYDNIVLNKFYNIVVYPYGLSDRQETREFNLGNGVNSGTNSILEIDNLQRVVICKFTRLSSLISEGILKRVKVCKIDVEGRELHALRGMAGSMKYLQKCIFIVEISPGLLAKTGVKVKSIYQYFKKYGFVPQYGLQRLAQWEEVFYHPRYNQELIFNPNI